MLSKSMSVLDTARTGDCEATAPYIPWPLAPRGSETQDTITQARTRPQPSTFSEFLRAVPDVSDLHISPASDPASTKTSACRWPEAQLLGVSGPRLHVRAFATPVKVTLPARHSEETSVAIHILNRAPHFAFSKLLSVSGASNP